MKTTKFTHIIILILLTILSNIFFIQLNAQTEWKELTIHGSSRVNLGNAYSVNNNLTKDKAGNIYAPLGKGVFKWNGSTWSELGSDSGTLNADVIYSIVADESGNIYADCFFSHKPIQYEVVKWDGSKWSALGTGNPDSNANTLGLLNRIYSMTADKQGNIYASLAKSVFKWNGSAWSELGNISDAGIIYRINSIYTLAIDTTGNVYVAGDNTDENGEQYILKWDGSEWFVAGDFQSPLPTKGYLYDLIIDSKNNIYVDDREHVYKLNGTIWSQLGNGSNANVSPNVLAIDAKDSLYEGSASSVEKWNGTTWVQVGSGGNAALNTYALTIDNTGNIYAGVIQYYFYDFYPNFYSNSYVTKWNGKTWTETGSFNSALNAHGRILTTANDKDGNEYAAGTFTDTLGKYYVAKWNGSSWRELGTGINALNANGSINAITTDDADNLYAAGIFKNDSAKTYVARWNGTTWSELGSVTIGALSANNNILSISVDAQGNVYAAGNFTNASGKYYVAKWDGTAWAELGSGSSALNANSAIYALCLDSKDNVYAAGSFTNTSGKNYVAKWNGSTWSQLPDKGDTDFFNQSAAALHSITSDSSGNIYAANDRLIGMEKWNGITWSKLGNLDGYVSSIKTDKSGDVYAAGLIPYPFQRTTVQKWDGAGWSEVGYDVSNEFSNVESINIDESKGLIYAGGDFTNSREYAYVAYNSISGILPLSFTSFMLQKINSSAQLNWQTVNEINTAYFNIQRSNDGRSFATIGKVEAIGNSKVQNSYAYVDDISQVNADRLYYRLQEVDNDDKFNYSGIKFIDIKKNGILFTISPNPAKDHINITSSAAVSDAQITISNVNGRTFYSTKHSFTNGEQLNVPVSSFANQTLFITITTTNGKQQFKVVKE